MSKKTKMGITIGFVAVVVIAIALVFATKTTPNAGGKSFTIAIESERDGFSETINCKSDLEFLGEYLRSQDYVDYQDSDWGIYITGLKGMSEDMENQYWWCLYVNGESSMTGADEVALTDGDAYSFVLTQGW